MKHLIFTLSFFCSISLLPLEQVLLAEPSRSGKAFFARVLADELKRRDQPHDSLAQKPNEKPQSFTAQKIMYGIGAAGAAVSFLVWLKPTIKMIQLFGLRRAINRTYVPRVTIDGLLVGACIQGFVNCSKMEELLNKDIKPQPTVS